MINTWMDTFTGKRFYPLDPNPDDICIEDIAHHLSNECRYGGACRFNYTVGQHCILGAKFVSEANRLPFLLHDASEAYLKDLLRGLKTQMPVYVEAEDKLQAIIYKKFGVLNVDYNEIKRVDYGMMATEVRVLMVNQDGWNRPEPPLDVIIVRWSHETVERVFLEMFHDYTN